MTKSGRPDEDGLIARYFRPLATARPARRGQRPVRGQHRGQIPAGDQAHVDEQPALDLTEVVDRDDVRLGQLRHQRGLLTEPGLELLVVGQVHPGNRLSATTR